MRDYVAGQLQMPGHQAGRLAHNAGERPQQVHHNLWLQLTQTEAARHVGAVQVARTEHVVEDDMLLGQRGVLQHVDIAVQ